MRNFPTHFWQRFQELKEERALTVVDESGATSTESFWEWTRRVRRLAVAFLEQGLEVGERVALVAPNSRDWLDVAFGAWLAGGTVVPVSERESRPTTLKCLGRSGATWIVVQDAEAYHRIRGQGTRLPEGLEWVLATWDGESSPGDSTTLLQLEEEGRSLVTRGRVDDLAEHIYELDATEPAAVFYENPPGADPHGALYPGETLGTMLTNLGSSLPLAEDASVAVLSPFSRPETLLLSAAALLRGCPLYLGDAPGALATHLERLGPTHVVCSSADLLEKTERWREQIQEAPEFLRATKDDAQGEAERGGFRLTNLLGSIGEQAAERLFYRPLRKQFGGELRAAFVLGPLLPADVEESLERANLDVLDVYGHAECGVSHLEQPGQHRPGAVGRPVEGYECRIDQPDASGRGEIMIRSETLFEDYWDGTGPRELADGWLATGETGRIDEGVLFVD